MRFLKHSQPVDPDVEREYIRSMVERASHSMTANTIGLLLLGCACLVVPFGKTLAIGLLLRITAVANSAINTKKVVEALRSGAPLDRLVDRFTYGMAYAGFTWGLLLWLIPPASFGSEAAVLVISIVIVGATLITSMAAPAPRVMLAFLAAFSVVMLTWLSSLTDIYGMMPAYFALGLCLGTISFGLGLTRQAHEAAANIVEKRRLISELAETNGQLEKAMAKVDLLARHDALTGLPNRRSFDEKAREIQKAGDEANWSVMLIDLDHFKAINDNAGHHAGDDVLRHSGALIQSLVELLPKGSMAARVGGEEFALLVTILHGDALRDFAHSMCGRFREIPAPDSYGRPVSASIGLARWQQGEAVHQFMQRADRALYAAKAQGRDRAIAA